MFFEKIQFILYCSEGNLELAKEFFYNNPNIDSFTSNDFEFGFQVTCEKGHLHVAQWLLTIKPDIDICIRENEVFRFACHYCHFHVALWLLCMKPDIDTSIATKVAKKYFANSFLLYCFHHKNINFLFL